MRPFWNTFLSFFFRPFFWNTSSEKNSDSSEEGGGFELGPEEECLHHHRSKSVFAGQPPPSKCLARRLLSHSPFQQGSKPLEKKAASAPEMVHNNGNTSSTSNKPNTMVSNCTLIQGLEKSKEKSNDIVAIDLVQFKYQVQQ